MTPAKQKLVQLLLDTGCLRFGNFTLKSGAASPFFCNLGQIDTGPALDAIGTAFADAIAETFPAATLLYGPAYKGITLAAAASQAAWTRRQRDLPFFYDRKEAKTHGERGRYVGRLPAPADTLVMLDDVLSDGGTKVEAIDAIHAAFSVRPAGILVVLDRRPRGVPLPPGLPPLRALLALPDLLDHLAATSSPHLPALQSFYNS